MLLLLGIDGRQVIDASLPANRHETDSLTTDELATDSVGADEISAASVTPAKLDRAYQEPIGTLQRQASSFRDISTINPTTAVVVNDEDAASFPDGSITGIRVAFEIPNNWDTSGNIELYLRLSPSTSFSGDFSVFMDYRKNGGAVQSGTTVAVTPSATADVQTRLGPIFTFSSGQISPGDGIVIRIERLGGDGSDTHTGAMRLFSVLLKINA